MFENIKAVFFDMDGTIVDSMWMWKKIDIEFLGKHNIELPDNLQREIEGMSFSETAVYFKERFSLAPFNTSEMADIAKYLIVFSRSFLP